jgi:hypothetical protein
LDSAATGSGFPLQPLELAITPKNVKRAAQTTVAGTRDVEIGMTNGLELEWVRPGRNSAVILGDMFG